MDELQDEQKRQDDAREQRQEYREEQAQKHPIPLTNDVIADTDLGEGPGNELGTLSPEKAQEVLQEHLREPGVADPRKAMSTDREPTTTRPDIDLGS